MSSPPLSYLIKKVIDDLEAYNYVISNTRLEELLTQNTNKLLDEHEIVKNKSFNPHDNSSLWGSSSKKHICAPKRHKISEISMSGSRNKRQKQQNVQFNNRKRHKHHKNSYQSRKSPYSSLISYDTDYYNRCRSYQHNSDFSFELITLNLSHSPTTWF